MTYFILLAVLYLATIVVHHIEFKALQEERQTLMDRVQAKDFQEYKVMTVPIAPKTPKPNPREELTPL